MIGYKRSLLFLICLSLCTVTVNSVAGGNTFSIEEVTPGNYLHRGTNAGFNDPGHDDIANIGFITGDNCVAVIDTGGSVTIGNALLNALRSVTDKPVCYVINTHVHFDHVLGNLAFINEKPEFVGHVNLPDAIEANRGFFLDKFRNYLGEAPSEKSIIAPTRTVAKTLSLDLGNRKLILTAYKKAHTYTDLSVFDEKTKTFWAGDLVFREHIPVIDGSLKGWLDVIQTLKKQDVALIIPGHGPVADNWGTAISAEEEYLTRLLHETRKAIAEGQFMEEAIDTIGLNEKDKWQLFDEHHKANVSRAFTELEWE